MEVAGWFVDPIVERVIKAGFDYLKDQVEKAQLDRLQLILPNIQAVVDYAFSQTEISDQNLKNWLWQLRDVIDEADDVLDDFEYIKHEQQLTTKNKKKKNTISSMKKGVVEFGKRALKIDPNLKKLEEVVNKLDEVSARVGVFLHLLKNSKEEQQEKQTELYKSRETGPLPKNDIIGRGDDKEHVMQWLMSKPSNEEGQTTRYKNISLLSIVGHGGMGKTTLLQHVYEDVKITEEFPLKVWVCVSTNFNAQKVIADMLDNLTKVRPPSDSSLSILQESLKSAVNSKKFLFVLDDIWEEENEERNKSKWGDVIAPLVSGCLGSKILITTRMESVASMMEKVIGKKKSEALKVRGLEERECLQLLNAHAFAGVENPDDHKKLRFIAEKMVKKLAGSPLAAKIMGGVLNSCLDERHWNKVLNSDIGDIMPILRLSYTFLPKYLQICFAFCGIFPQDHEFDKNDLVRMWIALGFIQPPNNREETMEDIGRRYFDALVKKSFFDKFPNKYYKMHDLLHELAQSVSKHECLRVEGDQELFFETPETIRHLFLQNRSQEELNNIRRFENLRSLFLDDYNGNVDRTIAILNATRKIRLLFIKFGNFKAISQAVGYLKHLRYLNVDSKDDELPTSLCNLYHMQFIIWNKRTSRIPSFIIPEDMNNLSNLRYLKFPFSRSPGIREIGKLTSLQKIDNFKVQNESGYKIGELEQMNDLRKLHIYSLNNVKDAQEACNAKLRDKKNLTDFSLNWDDFRDPIDIDLNDEKVLDNLQPPRCLKKLFIKNYTGVRSAKWMNTPNFISNLEIIKLNSCSNWRTLPPFGKLHFLKSLHLDSMPEVKQFDDKFHGNDEPCVFPSIEMSGDIFPCLTELHLSNCPNLQELSYLPPKLNKLFIYNIGWETLNCCSISKLEELNVSCCPNITNIYLERIAALRLLKIQKCPNLNYLGEHTEVETTENNQLILSRLKIDDPSILLMEPLRSITSVQELVIENNDELVSFPFEEEGWFQKVSSSLFELGFASLKSLQSLPSSLESLSSIKTLFVIEVPQLRELPNLPPSLDYLYLRNLDNLDCLPSCLPSLSSLIYLTIRHVPQLRELPNLPHSLARLDLENLDNLDCLPSSLPSLSSLRDLSIKEVPQLRELPNLPPSLGKLDLTNLDNLDCLPSCLPSLSSLNKLTIINLPKLRELQSLPPSLVNLSIENVPQLRELPNLPPSLRILYLRNLDNLDCLPSCLPSLSSLEGLSIWMLPKLRELPSIPPSLDNLYLKYLDNLDCLPSCLPNLCSLRRLLIENVPQLQELPNLPPSLRFLEIIRVSQLRDLPDLPSSLNEIDIGACHPKLMKRCQRYKDSDWRKIVVRVID